MNERVRTLREQSLNAVNRLTAERALLVTEFYGSAEANGLPVPVARAAAFRHILEHKKICINPGELIVGERGPAPKATPTYPEICLHTLEDLEILDGRPTVSFQVDDETRQAYRDVIIPFWQGKSTRDLIMARMAPEWLAAYRAGMFTEFQEQRAPGHTALDGKIYSKGMLDFRDDIRRSLERLAGTDPQTAAQRQQLEAMDIAAGAIIRYAERHAEMLDQLAAAEADPARKRELLEMAGICRRVPAHAPRTFHEALQYYWFVHLGVITEVNPWDSFNPGRLDQHLGPFYARELAAGTLTEERARELLQCLWVKFNNQPAPPKMGVTAKESNTYTDFALINIGGLGPDGRDGANPVSYLLLDVIEEMRLLQPSSMVQLSAASPDALLHRALKIIRTGFGQPSLFNSDMIVKELVRQGKAVEDARQGGASGCVESGAFGKEAYFLTGYFNLAKLLELALHDGFDPLTGAQAGPRTGDPRTFRSFADLMAAYTAQLRHLADVKIAGNIAIERVMAERLPVPFLSLLIDDCIASGRDYNAGGARYNTSYLQGVGIGTLTDSLTALRRYVFDNRTATIDEFLKALDRDFAGDEELHHRLVYQTPKYGNDDDYADAQTRQVFDAFFAAVDGRPTGRGGTFRINLLPTTCHVYFGSVTGATPDGRKAGTPLSEGISPVQGADRTGPTAAVRSASKLDHARTGGTLLNQKFAPQFFADDEAIAKLGQLVRGYFKLGGHHIQFNVVDAATLRDAQRHPERHRDLIVRVAGYSDYFNDLTPELQEEIILRTEHGAV